MRTARTSLPVPASLPYCLALVAAALAGALAAATVTGAAEGGAVMHLRIKSPIQPVAAEFLRESLATADAESAALLVVELDTPGGLDSSMHEMTGAIVGARTPVVVYVSPRGARAASAGFFLLMAADVAAMAPDTHTGAAAAVGPQGGELPETMKKKVAEDSTAKIRALAARRGRNVELAVAAVAEARSFTAQEALDAKLIELVAADLPSLLAALDGRAIDKGTGGPVKLATAGRPVREIEMSLFERILAVLADPTIAYLLLSLGSLGLVVELYNPGAILPGVVGAICVVLGFWGLSVLPVSTAAIALLVLGLFFFIAEIKVVSYGLLSVAGAVCLVLAGLMLIKTPEPALRVSRGAIAGVAVFALVAAGLLMTLALRAYRRPVATGAEGLLAARGEARTALDPRGKVFVHGELWNAVAEGPLGEGRVERGRPVEIVAVDGLTLRVRPVGESPAGGG